MSVDVAPCTCDGSAHVCEHVESLLGQSFPVDEIVLAADGSYDDVVARVQAVHVHACAQGVAVPVLTVLPAAGRRLGARQNVERAPTALETDVVLLAAVPGMTPAVRRAFLAVALPIPEGWPHDAWLVSVAAMGALRIDPEPRTGYRTHERHLVGAVGRVWHHYQGPAHRLPAHRRAERPPPRGPADASDQLRRPGRDHQPLHGAGAREARIRARPAALPRRPPTSSPAGATPAAAAPNGRLSPNGAWDVLRDLTLRGAA